MKAFRWKGFVHLEGRTVQAQMYAAAASKAALMRAHGLPASAYGDLRVGAPPKYEARVLSGGGKIFWTPTLPEPGAELQELPDGAWGGAK